MEWSIILWSALRGALTAIVVLFFCADWAMRKADEKFDIFERPFRHCLRFVGFAMLPILPVLLVVNVVCAYFF